MLIDFFNGVLGHLVQFVVHWIDFEFGLRRLRSIPLSFVYVFMLIIDFVQVYFERCRILVRIFALTLPTLRFVQAYLTVIIINVLARIIIILAAQVIILLLWVALQQRGAL